MHGTARRGRLFTLDCVRGAAALLVCVQHLRNGTIVDYGQLVTRHGFEAAFYFLTNLGHESVMVFFVLSGFFVGGSVVRAGSAFNWADYLLARALRLWCVLIPCLLLTFLCDRWLSAHMPGVLRGDYAALWHSAPSVGSYDASWGTALGNAFFLQTVGVPVYGSNGPLWSLANEAWYYVLFPLLFVAYRAGPTSRRIAFASIALLLAFVMPAAMRWLFVVWVFGVAVHVLDRRSVVLRRGALAISAALFAMAIGVSRLRLIPSAWDPASDYLVGAAFAGFCLALVRGEGRMRVPDWLRRGAVWLSEISFSLYLSHFPIVLIIAAARHGQQRAQPDAGGLLAFAGWLALLLVVGHAMWWSFERRTPAVRAWIGTWHARRQAVNE